MKSLENFKIFLRETLINNNGDIKPNEHTDIIQYAKNLGLDARKLSKLLQEVNSTINWDFIEQQKKEQNAPLKERRIKGKTIATQAATADTKQTGEYYKSGGVPVKTKGIVTFPRVLLAVIIVFFIYVVINAVNETNKPGIIMYNYADELALRSSPEISYGNILGNLAYGTEIKVYSSENGWAKCAINDKQGFVASEFLVDKKHFVELEAIFGDSNAKRIVTKTRYKKALLNYFRSKNIMGNMPEETQVAIYGVIQNKEKWQIFTADNANRYNSVFYDRIVSRNSKFEDLACIIQNIHSKERRFLLFTFLDSEEPYLAYESPAPLIGNIKSVKRHKEGYKVYYSSRR